MLDKQVFWDVPNGIKEDLLGIRLCIFSITLSSSLLLGFAIIKKSREQIKFE